MFWNPLCLDFYLLLTCLNSGFVISTSVFHACVTLLRRHTFRWETALHGLKNVTNIHISNGRIVMRLRWMQKCKLPLDNPRCLKITLMCWQGFLYAPHLQRDLHKVPRRQWPHLKCTLREHLYWGAPFLLSSLWRKCSNLIIGMLKRPPHFSLVPQRTFKDFQQLKDFQGLSRTVKDFQGLSRTFKDFKLLQGLF